MRTPQRFPTHIPLQSKLAVFALLLATLMPCGVRAQTIQDRHVSALTDRALVTQAAPSLVDAVRQRRARAIADDQQILFLAWALAPILAFLALWQTGNAARLRDVLRRRFRTRWAVRAAFGAVLGALAVVVAFPFAFASYRVAAGVGLTQQPIPSWFLEEIARAVEAAVCTAIAVAVALELVDRTRLWYLAFIGLLYVVALGTIAVEPVLFSPLASHHRPAPAWLVAQADAVARVLDVTPVDIETTTDAARSALVPARTSGLGPFTRILLDSDGLARTTPRERAYILARQYAHVRRHDVLVLTLCGTTLFIFAAALAVLISDRIGFRRDDDPLARLALVGTFLGLTTLAFYPAYNAIERSIELQADRVAVDALDDRAAAVRIIVRSADDNLVPLCGRRSTRWYFDSRPNAGSRIAALTGAPDPCSPDAARSGK